MMAPPLRAAAICPKCDFFTQSSKDVSEVRPRVRVTSPALGRPGSFLIMYLPSGVFCLSSMTSCSSFRPVTSWMALITMPSNSRPNEWPTEVSRWGRGMDDYLPFLDGLLGDQAGAARELGEAENDELGRLHGRHPDLADDLAGIDAL